MSLQGRARNPSPLTLLQREREGLALGHVGELQKNLYLTGVWVKHSQSDGLSERLAVGERAVGPLGRSDRWDPQQTKLPSSA